MAHLESHHDEAKRWVELGAIKKAPRLTFNKVFLKEMISRLGEEKTRELLQLDKTQTIYTPSSFHDECYTELAKARYRMSDADVAALTKEGRYQMWDKLCDDIYEQMFRENYRIIKGHLSAGNSLYNSINNLFFRLNEMLEVMEQLGEKDSETYKKVYAVQQEYLDEVAHDYGKKHEPLIHSFVAYGYTWDRPEYD